MQDKEKAISSISDSSLPPDWGHYELDADTDNHKDLIETVPPT